VPRIIDYALAHAQLTALGLRSLYHNSGAFGFAPDARSIVRGWIGRPDPTIRPHSLAAARQLPEPFAESAARLACEVWRGAIGGEAWIMPMSHWGFELEFGSAPWLGDLLRRTQINPVSLAGRNTADPIVCAPGEQEAFVSILTDLLDRLTSSDFAVAFPAQPVLCTVHHHGQLWWQARDQAIVDALDRLVPAPLKETT
jgi:hypothetical protein